jgi:hypothetical protein
MHKALMYRGNAGGNGDWKMDGRMAKDQMDGLARRKRDGRGMKQEGARMASLSTLMLYDSIGLVERVTHDFTIYATLHYVTPRSALLSEN